MDFKDRMIEAYERGECSYDGAYEHVRESYADRADAERKRRKETPTDDIDLGEEGDEDDGA